FTPAHTAAPAGDAVCRAARLISLEVPLVISVHGGDVFYTARLQRGGAAAVASTLESARLVLANSQGVADLSRAQGAGETRVVHLGADTTAAARPPLRPPRPVTVRHSIARKRDGDVRRALAVLSPRHPQLRYAIIGEGPERAALQGLAARLGVLERVDFHGQLPPAEAVEQARRGTLLVMPST